MIEEAIYFCGMSNRRMMCYCLDTTPTLDKESCLLENGLLKQVERASEASVAKVKTQYNPMSSV